MKKIFIYAETYGYFMKSVQVTRDDGSVFISNVFSSNRQHAKMFENADEVVSECHRLKEAGYNKLYIGK